MGVALCLGATGAAHAQTTGTGATAEAETAAASPDAPVDIVVTGSRVGANGFRSPTPLTVLGIADLQRDAPINIANAVNKLPQFSGSATSQNTSNSVSDGNAGVNNLNLRALGANRTLVLLDGMRVVPSSVTGFYNNGGTVDINTFPDALIKRVDVVTGGASAVYGSDAVAGAVNFVLDKTFTGLKGEALGGITTKGDDETYRFSLTVGKSFAEDRGHIILSGAYTHNEGILSGFSRKWLADDIAVPINNPAYTPTNGQPFIIVARRGGSAQYTPGGLITAGPLRGTDFIGSGGTRTFDFGSPTDGNYMSGGDYRETIAATGNYLRPSNSLDPELTRKNAFARASFDVTDDIEVFGQFIYSKTDTFTLGGSQTQSNTTIRSGNPFIPAAIQQQMTALGLTSFVMAKDVSSEIGYNRVSNDREFFQYAGGASGRFEAFRTAWSWDASVSHNTSESTISIPNDLVRPYYALATNVVTNPANGAPICASTLVDPANGCVPFNPFGVGVASRDAINYVRARAYLDQKLKQTEAIATLRGAPFSTWAGPVSLALGVEHRSLSVDGESTELDRVNAFYTGNFKVTKGSVKTTEGFAEILVPLARDLSWARELSVNGAARLTDYSTSGRVTTWKAGVTYSPVSDLLFRATRSRDIRAPNLGELFSPGQSGTSFIRDPFRNNATVPYVNIRVGNAGLRPEISDNTSAGVVLRPSFVEGLDISVDYYRIKVKQAINSTAAQSVVDSCFAGFQAFCGFVQRDPAGAIAIVYQSPANTAFLNADGFDVEASYTRPLSSLFDGLGGSITLRGFVNRALTLDYQQTNGQKIDGVGVNFGNNLITPKWQYNASVTYGDDRFTASWTGRGFSSGVQGNNYFECTSACPASIPTLVTISDNHVPGQFLMDLNFTYRVPIGGLQDVEFFAHVDNVANSVPSGVARIGFYPGNHDVLGRMFRGGVRFKL